MAKSEKDVKLSQTEAATPKNTAESSHHSVRAETTTTNTTIPHRTYVFDREDVSRRLAQVVMYDCSPLVFAPDYIQPLYVTSKLGKSVIVESKLERQFQLDEAVRATVGAQAEEPIHIFVDLSNIIIGFYDRLKLDRGIPIVQRYKAPAFAFETFAFILERGRPSSKKIVAGSTVDPWSRWPKYMLEAEDAGYEMNILQRVTKDANRKAKKWGKSNDYGSTTPGGDYSSDDIMTTGVIEVKQAEQGVDELLHLKMLQSVCDDSPGTLVLATGDAAEAEYSDGFLKNVERALSAGWAVELVAWTQGISSSWRNSQFQRKWSDRFRIIELDSFSEELFACWVDDEDCA